MTRRYELKQRAQRQADTRRRILEATVELHVERGLVATQITDIAQRAGVDRVTVYRHIPDLASLFKACAAHYYSAHPLPDPTAWAAIGDPQARLRHGLGELYAYWAHNAAQVLASGWSPADQHQPALAATIRVAVDFHTWQCLVGERGLSEQAAVELAVTWTRCLTSPR